MRGVFLIVLDSFGIGEAPDAAAFGDAGSNTLRACHDTGILRLPNMRKLGLYNIDGVSIGRKVSSPAGSYARLAEKSAGKDTTTGHWEMAGLVSEKPLPVFPDGFPDEIIREIEKRTGRRVLCNKPYSGTQVILDYGREHMSTGALIVYTSADSVLQIAAHESVIPCEELWDICGTVREIMTGEYAVGRIIARPFIGEYPDFVRTSNRHDFSVAPFSETMLDKLKNAGKDVIAVGKITDIFDNRGITESIRTVSNRDGMVKTLEVCDRDFNGLCFTNLVDFDSAYGHRNDPKGYALALNRFDRFLPGMINKLRKDDLLMITGDHGCDPSTESTDHSREYVPLLIFGKNLKKHADLGTRDSFTFVSEMILDYLK